MGDFLFNWLPLIAVVLAAGFGAFLLRLGLRGVAKSILLGRRGVPGKAVVRAKTVEIETVRSEERTRREPARRHFLEFALTVAGRVHAGREIAPTELWDRVEVGDAVEVIYLPSAPSTMRLAAWPQTLGTVAGTIQLVVGGLLFAVSLAFLISGAMSAIAGPAGREKGADWTRTTAEVLRVAEPEDPFLRLFSPGARVVHVVFGDTDGGRLMGNTREVMLPADRLEGVAEGAILRAWANPANDYDAILDLERP